MGYDITVYRVISCVITPDHHKTPCCGLRFALASCLCPLLDWSSAWPFWSSFCCQSDEHITGLTVPLANTNSSRLGLLYECMIAFVPFFFFTFPVSFLVIYIPKMFSILISILTEKVKKNRMIYREIQIRYRTLASEPPVFLISEL